MINRIETYICNLLLEEMKDLFRSNPVIKQIDMKYLEDGDYITRSINLTIEKKIECPDGQIMVVDEQKDISNYSNRTPTEKNFAESIERADEYMKVVFGNYPILCLIESTDFLRKRNLSMQLMLQPL